MSFPIYYQTYSVYSYGNDGKVLKVSKISDTPKISLGSNKIITTKVE